VTRRRGGEQCCGKRGLARTRFTGDRHPAAELHQRTEERRRLAGERVARREIVERDIADDVAPERGGEAIAHGRDRRGEPSRTVEDARLHHGVLGVELTVSRREQALDHLPVLVLACRHGEPPQVPGSIEVRDARSFEKDLFDVATCDEVGHRAEIGDRPQHPIDHDQRRHERQLLTKPRKTLVLVDCSVYLDPHLIEIAFGPKLPPLDPRKDAAPDPLVRVDGHRCTPLMTFRSRLAATLMRHASCGAPAVPRGLDGRRAGRRSARARPRRW
jgi:hypothetical protein